MFDCGARIRRRVGRSMLALALLVPLGGSALAGNHLVIGGSGTGLAAIRHLATEFALSNALDIQVLPSIGTGGAIKALNAGDIQLGLGSRPLKPDEAGRRITERLYARTPMIFVTGLELPIQGLTRQQISALFSGELDVWPNGVPVRPILRPGRESDTQVLVAAFPELRAILSRARDSQAVVAFSDQENARMLERVPGAIGTTTLSQIRSERRRLRPLRLDGVEPSLASLANGSYPLGKSLFFLVRRDAPPEVLRFIDYALGPGRDYLSRNGHLLVD